VATAVPEAASAGAVSTAEVSVVGSTEEALPVAVSAALVVSVGHISPVAVSTALAFVVAVSVGGTLLAATVIRVGGTGAIRTDITVTTITRTVTMDTADTRTMDTAGTVTTVAAVTDAAIAADQGIPGVSGGGDKPVRRFEIARLLVLVDNDADYVDPSDMACAANIATLPPRTWIDETDGRTWFIGVKRARQR